MLNWYGLWSSSFWQSVSHPNPELSKKTLNHYTITHTLTLTRSRTVDKGGGRGQLSIYWKLFFWVKSLFRSEKQWSNRRRRICCYQKYWHPTKDRIKWPPSWSLNAGSTDFNTSFLTELPLTHDTIFFVSDDVHEATDETQRQTENDNTNDNIVTEMPGPQDNPDKFLLYIVSGTVGSAFILVCAGFIVYKCAVSRKRYLITHWILQFCVIL